MGDNKNFSIGKQGNVTQSINSGVQHSNRIDSDQVEQFLKLSRLFAEELPEAEKTTTTNAINEISKSVQANDKSSLIKSAGTIKAIATSASGNLIARAIVEAFEVLTIGL